MNADFIRNRITQLRLQKDVSEYKMSYDLGHSRGYIYNISSGKTLPSMTEFLAICDYFSVTPVEFFQEDIENPNALNSVMEDISRLSIRDLEIIKVVVGRLLEK